MSSEMIISLPGQQSVGQRSLYATLTALAWLAWVHLWLPVITLGAWAVGIDVLYQQSMMDDVGHGIDDFLFLLRAASVCAFVFLVWSNYNRWRYGGPERRGPVENTSQDDIADYFGASDIVSNRLRRMRRTVLHVDPSGRPIRAVVDPPALCTLPVVRDGDDEHGYDQRPVTVEHPEQLTPVG